MCITSATIAHRWQGELLFLTHRGVVTAEILGTFRRFLADRLTERDVRAVVADFRGASQVFSFQEARDTAIASAAALALVPVAMVVSPVEQEVARQFVEFMVKAGMHRAVFTDIAEAISWAASHRGHWEWPPGRLVQCSRRAQGA